LAIIDLIIHYICYYSNNILVFLLLQQL